MLDVERLEAGHQFVVVNFVLGLTLFFFHHVHAYQVQYKGAPTVFTPESICGLIMGSLKASAEAFVHSPVKNCVLAAPIVSISLLLVVDIHTSCA
jgi:hypothetical protein